MRDEEEVAWWGEMQIIKIAGDGSVDAAHNKSFVYIGHTYLDSRSEELLQV